MEQLIGANEKQVAGDHYRAKAIQPWDYILANQLGYLEGNIVKYVSRWKEKGGVQDLQKAKHYLDKLIEVTEASSKRPHPVPAYSKDFPAGMVHALAAGKVGLGTPEGM